MLSSASNSTPQHTHTDAADYYEFLEREAELLLTTNVMLVQASRRGLTPTAYPPVSTQHLLKSTSAYQITSAYL